MQAYATAERLSPPPQLRASDPTPYRAPDAQATGDRMDPTLLDGLLSRLADLVVDRLTERVTLPETQAPDDWMDARAAASYLGIRRDTVRKLAAERAIPVHQDGPGCKLFFRRDELDEWRRSGKAPSSRLRVVA